MYTTGSTLAATGVGVSLTGAFSLGLGLVILGLAAFTVGKLISRAKSSKK